MKACSIPQNYKIAITNTFGAAGKQWLEKLPSLIEFCESQYNLILTKPIPRLSYNYIVEAIREDGTAVIAKFLCPDPQAEYEIYALRLMACDAVVKLYEYDSQHRIAILEKLTPGEVLTDCDDDEAAAIVAELIAKLSKPYSQETTPFPTTRALFKRLEQPVQLPKDFPQALIDQAKQIADELHQSLGKPVLLHGDLHHENILSCGNNQWCAIDPKGMIGEREYEVGAFLRNPIVKTNQPDITVEQQQKRIALFSEMLNFDKQRLAAWGFAQAVLAAVWCLDDKSSDWQHFVNCAQRLRLCF